MTIENRARLEEFSHAGQGTILVTWHGRMLIPIHAFRGRRYWTLLSPSNDGEVLSEALHRLGWRVVRGSTGRGGVKAALELSRRIQEGGILAFTPDGPRGPARSFSRNRQGAL